MKTVKLVIFNFLFKKQQPTMIIINIMAEIVVFFLLL